MDHKPGQLHGNHALTLCLDHPVGADHIRCDNGPEMISKALRKWVAKAGPQIQYIASGSPWENGNCESFNGELRAECLRQEIFSSLKEAQTVINCGRTHTITSGRTHPWTTGHPRLSPSRIWPSGYQRQRPCSSLSISPVQNTSQVNPKNLRVLPALSHPVRPD